MKLKDFIDKKQLGLYVNAIKKGQTTVEQWGTCIVDMGTRFHGYITPAASEQAARTESREYNRSLTGRVMIPVLSQDSYCALSLLMSVAGILPTTEEFWGKGGMVELLIETYERDKDWKAVLALCF